MLSVLSDFEKEKKNSWFLGKILRTFFLTTVEGRRDRWSGYPPDWG
jgi:hypothetical protein